MIAEFSDAAFSFIAGALVILGLLLGYPAVMTGIALLRSERVLSKLFWQFVTAIDSRRGRKGNQTDEPEST